MSWWCSRGWKEDESCPCSWCRVMVSKISINHIGASGIRFSNFEYLVYLVGFSILQILDNNIATMTRVLQIDIAVTVLDSPKSIYTAEIVCDSEGNVKSWHLFVKLCSILLSFCILEICIPSFLCCEDVAKFEIFQWCFNNEWGMDYGNLIRTIFTSAGRLWNGWWFRVRVWVLRWF